MMSVLLSTDDLIFNKIYLIEMYFEHHFSKSISNINLF